LWERSLSKNGPREAEEEDEEFNVHVIHKGTESAVFGEHVDQSVRGVFHISTSDAKPFLRETLQQ